MLEGRKTIARKLMKYCRHCISHLLIYQSVKNPHNIPIGYYSTNLNKTYLLRRFLYEMNGPLHPKLYKTIV